MRHAAAQPQDSFGARRTRIRILPLRAGVALALGQSLAG
jgi:hypothetical protein